MISRLSLAVTGAFRSPAMIKCSPASVHSVSCFVSLIVGMHASGISFYIVPVDFCRLKSYMQLSHLTFRVYQCDPRLIDFNTFQRG